MARSLFFVLFFISTSSFAETHVVFLGDSLTEGYGLSKEEAYPFLVEKQLKSEGLKVKCTNAGISGSTSASGPNRWKWFLKQNPDVLVLALGANDGLRGLDLKKTKEHLRQVIQSAKKEEVRVLLAGMKMPSNLGSTYTKQFESLYSDLAKEESVPLIPFLLEGVATKRDLNLPDGIHPNAKGHVKMAETVIQHLRPLLK